MNSELGRKIGNWLGPQNARMGLAPGLFVAQIFLELAMSMMNPTVQHHFTRPGFEPLRIELAEQRDRVVIQLPPANRIQVAKQVDHFRLPRPPDIVRQRDTLVEKQLRRGVGRGWQTSWIGLHGVNLAHAMSLNSIEGRAVEPVHANFSERPGLYRFTVLRRPHCQRRRVPDLL